MAGCEATQFAVAVTDQNAVGCAADIKANSECNDDSCDMAKTLYVRAVQVPANKSVLIGCSHGKLNRFTATQAFLQC